MSTYECVVTTEGRSINARLAITPEGIRTAQGNAFALSFADLMDMRLLNYRIRLFLRDGEAEISQLGYQTEDFFEQVWLAYAAKSRASLFVDGKALMCSEGDYAYSEQSGQAHGIAKLEVFPDCVCVHPHDVGARRIPLCFVDDCHREGFSLTLALDTGERYRLARLGRDTDPFFDRIVSCRKSFRARWQNAHTSLVRELDARLGDARERYAALRRYASKVEVGLFSADDEGFWMAAVAPGRAAIELVTGEDTATYLYRHATADDEFVLRLRHAMEAVRTNRRVIFLDDDEVDRTPLYRMSIDRSAHVRFLRSCSVGRLIHTKNWEGRLATFLRDTP